MRAKSFFLAIGKGVRRIECPQAFCHLGTDLGKRRPGGTPRECPHQCRPLFAAAFHQGVVHPIDHFNAVTGVVDNMVPGVRNRLSLALRNSSHEPFRLANRKDARQRRSPLPPKQLHRASLPIETLRITGIGKL
ncbi:hypothetical protein [Streptomyces chattanoogensis]|uniref:hypothetical protein n=1 Tax=Streptomyces chattanoogensis TaxID=66876 RepID=UPI0036774689